MFVHWKDLPAGLERLVKRSESWYRRQVARRARTGAHDLSEAAGLAGLADDRPSRRWTAAAALGKNALRSAEAVAALAGALADPEPFVRWQAAEALAAQEPGATFPVLRRLLNAPDPALRAGAALAMSRMAGEAAGVELRAALNDADAGVRSAACEALGCCGDPGAVRDLVPLLDDWRPEVVGAAATALGRLGDPSAACSLAEAFTRPEQPLLVRRALAAGLAHAPHPEVQDVLLEALRDPDPQVRGYAAQALGQVGDESAWPALAAVRQDPSRLIAGTVGDQAGKALALLERRGRHAPPPPTDADNEISDAGDAMGG